MDLWIVEVGVEERRGTPDQAARRMTDEDNSVIDP